MRKKKEKKKKRETGRGLAAPRPAAPPLTDFGLSSNRHKDQAPAAAGVAYGFLGPPAAGARPGARGRMYIDVTAAEVPGAPRGSPPRNLLCYPQCSL